MSTDVKLSKVKISKMIKSSALFDSCIGNLWMKALRNIAISLARDIAISLARHNLPRLVRNLASNAKNKFERNMTGKKAARTGKEFIWFFSNEYMKIIKIIVSYEDSRFNCIN